MAEARRSEPRREKDTTATNRVVAAFRDRWEALPQPARRILGGVVLVGLLLLIIAPEADTGGPSLTSSQIGTVAPYDVKAQTTFTWERDDPEGIASVRERATASVLPVWDFDAALNERVVYQTSRAFETLRTQLRVEAGKRLDALPSREEAIAARDAAAANGEEPEALGDGPWREDYPPDRVIELLSEAERVAMAQNLAVFEEVGSRRGARLPVRALEALARDGFSASTQGALEQLVRAAMERHLVEDRSLLDQLGPEGITLRSLGDESAPERQIRNFRDFYDVGSARDIAYGLASRLPGVNDPQVASALEEILSLVAQPNTRPNQVETNRRRAAAGDQAEERYRRQQRRAFQNGELILRAGEVITPDAFSIWEQMRASSPPNRSAWLNRVALGLLIALLLWSVLLFAQLQLRQFSARPRDLTMMGTVLVVHVGLTELLSMIADAIAAERGAEALYIVRLFIPFGFGAMLVRLLTRADNAIVYALVYAMLAGVMLDFDVDYAMLSLVAGLVGGMSLGRAESRAAVFLRCIWMGAAMSALAFTLSLARGGLDMPTVVTRTIAAFGSGLVSAAVLFFLLPALEYVFRYTTTMRLMELSSLNHPALRDLILKAPGTYHHSMMVGQLVEAGCEAVGANALLGRVGAYFHDIGKMKNPGYFAENQHGDNPHNRIAPHMSALIIKSHVRDGVEMAREYGLPEDIVQFIREHHGTSLIRFFYHKAKEENPDVLESDFRYPGPPPQSRETAICLLADGIEAASRAMPEPTPSRLKGLIQRMINSAFTDGQLDECDLTLRDLHAIADAFHRRLTAIYHHRPEYPDARKSTSKTHGSTPPRDRGAGESGSVDAVKDGAAGPRKATTRPTAAVTPKDTTGPLPAQPPRNASERSPDAGDAPVENAATEETRGDHGSDGADRGRGPSGRDAGADGVDEPGGRSDLPRLGSG